MQFTTDGGTTYRLSSPLQGLQPNAFYRIICSYALTGEISDAYPVAKIYTAESVNLLKLTEENAEADDPTAVTSIWIGGKYLNMQLTPKTQGGTQSWGYRVDYVGRTSSGKAYYHLSLYHRQPNDPYSYSTTVYASLPLTDVDSIQKGDSIAFTVLTFSGRKTWRFSFD
ncbi:MAG: hypothetical protein LUC45_07260 [Paraprevotella sp.]|nr:hypothetical protein [Paraprevotella sp.]